MKKAAIHTLGCKVNQYESEAIAELLQAAGYELVSFDDYADCYIVNTCTVTGLSDRKSRQMIRRAKKKNPHSVLAVTGCYAQTASQQVAELEEVDLVVGTSNRAALPALLERAKEGQVIAVSDIMKETSFEELSVTHYTERTRAFLKIQDGCDRYCSYCIIPYARGHIRSRDPEQAVRQAIQLSQNGYSEIVLAGIHVASYGKDLGNTSLLDLLCQIQKIDGIERIRISSIEPNYITADFCHITASLSKFCPHFHISLQSGCDETLRRMNRHYTTKEYAQAVREIRAAFPNPAISTDVMVGFAGETEEEFATSLRFVEQMAFSRLHVFPYSIRPGTKAASFPDQVAPQQKEERAKQMLALGHQLTQQFSLSQCGRSARVLAERRTPEGLWEGFTENYTPVVFSSQQDLAGKIIPVRLLSLQGETILGEL